MVKRILIIIAVVIVLGVAAFFALRSCSQRALSAAQRNIQTATVTRGPLLASVSTAGTVETAATANLSFQATGLVNQVLVREGDQVTAGQIIATLDATDAELQVAQAEAGLAIAQARLAQTQKGAAAEDIAAARASLAAAEESLRKLQAGPTPEDIELARLNWEQAKDQLWGAQAQRDATLGNPMASGGAKDQAEAAVASAEMAVEIARIRYEQAQRGATADQLRAAEAQVAQARANLAKLLSTPGAEDVQAAKAQVQQAEVTLKQAQAVLEKTRLKAPFAGTITRLNLVVGELVGTAAQPAAILSAPGALQISAEMSEIDISRVREGMAVEIVLDALPGKTFQGWVSQVALAGTTTQGVVNYPVTIQFQDVDESIRPGMTANATIVIERRENVLLVPNRAIRSQNGQRVVRVLRDGQVQEVVVQTGLTGEGQTEILGDSLHEGDVLLLTSATTSLTGMGTSIETQR